jgi:hypothetical protein
MPRADSPGQHQTYGRQERFRRIRYRRSACRSNRDYTVFLLEQANFPFGAAEYIGDLSVDSQGNGQAEYRLIVKEAFASTLVNGKRVRADLSQVGMWFADPKDDDFCLGPNGGPVTPFDGDNEAGALAFNSAPTAPLPAAIIAR